MKPVIFYVDDEPHNLAVFEAAAQDEWEVRTFDNPLKALEAMNDTIPWVVLSDQRMPGITGVQFLELTRKLHASAIRVIVTGYSEEELVIESVRKAQVFDYLKKPWDPDDLVKTVQRAIDFHIVTERSKALFKELEDRNKELTAITADLERGKARETALRTELQAWVHPFVLWALESKQTFPLKKDLVGLTFDIIGSSNIHQQRVADRSLRSLVIQSFSEAVIRNGGWRESHTGDSAYAHFGLMDSNLRPADAALSAASEFRVALRGLSKTHGFTVESGIGLHLARQSVVDVHTVILNTPHGPVTQKSFDTTSTDIDLLHRMEKLAHELPGSNIVLSRDFLDELSEIPKSALLLGDVTLKGQTSPATLYIIPSDLCTEAQIEELRKRHSIVLPSFSKKAIA